MNGRNLMIAVLSVFMGLMMACDATVHEYPVPDKSFFIIKKFFMMKNGIVRLKIWKKYTPNRMFRMKIL